MKKIFKKKKDSLLKNKKTNPKISSNKKSIEGEDNVKSRRFRDNFMIVMKSPFFWVVYVGAIATIIAIVIFAVLELGQTDRSLNVANVAYATDGTSDVILSPADPGQYTTKDVAGNEMSSMFYQQIYVVPNPRQKSSSDENAPEENAKSSISEVLPAITFDGDVSSLQPSISGRICFSYLTGGQSYIYSLVLANNPPKQTGVENSDVSGINIYSDLTPGASNNIYVPTTVDEIPQTGPTAIQDSSIYSSTLVTVGSSAIVNENLYEESNSVYSLVTDQDTVRSVGVIIKMDIIYVTAEVTTAKSGNNVTRKAFSYFLFRPYLFVNSVINSNPNLPVFLNNSGDESFEYSNIISDGNTLGYDNFSTLILAYNGKPII